MNQFVLTRFNLRLWWKHDKAGGEILTEEWLEERFRLFEEYCLPSMMGQTCQDFIWICLFDEATPQRFRERVGEICRKCQTFRPFYLNTAETHQFQAFFRRKVYELSDHEDEALLTTYLDNDDCLRCDFLERVRTMAEGAEYGTVFSFRYGLQYYEEHNIGVRIPYGNNHFLTFYERLSKEIRTIWGFWHFSIYKYKGLRIEMVEETENPMWIEVIHRGNIDNDVKMTLRHRLITDGSYGRRFGLLKPWLAGRSAVCVFSSRFLLRALGQVVRRGVNKILRQ